MIIRGHLAVACLFLAMIATAVAAYPVPSGMPSRWELEFKPGDLRLYVDPVERETYWCFNYTVTNRTGRDQIWAPSLVLYTDAGEIMQSGEGVPMRVTENIIRLLGNELAMNQFEIIGDLLQGREHAKDGVVVWPARHLNVTELSLFIAGISGETAVVKHPLTGENVVLRKTLQREYLVPGDPVSRGSEPLQYTEQQWIFR